MAVAQTVLLNRQRLIELLDDAKFFVACPLFFFLEDAAKAAVADYRKQVKTRRERACQNCGGYASQLDMIIGNFVRTALKAHHRNPALLGPLRTYLVQRTGEVPEAFVLGYTENGQRKELRL
jgi:hypothetical protein